MVKLGGLDSTFFSISPSTLRKFRILFAEHDIESGYIIYVHNSLYASMFNLPISPSPHLPTYNKYLTGFDLILCMI